MRSRGSGFVTREVASPASSQARVCYEVQDVDEAGPDAIVDELGDERGPAGPAGVSLGGARARRPERVRWRAMDLLLVRHGLPLRVERDDGLPADPPLGAEGRAQAESVARWLAHERIDHIVASPLRRARETAEPLAKALGLELEVEPRVAEFDRDSAFYVPLEELKRTDYPAWREFMENGYGGGPPLEVFVAEVRAALDACIARHRGRRVAVFCHGGVINVFAAQVLGASRPLFFQPHYTSINRFAAASSGERSVIALNEVAHLEAPRRLGRE